MKCPECGKTGCKYVDRNSPPVKRPGRYPGRKGDLARCRKCGFEGEVR